MPISTETVFHKDGRFYDYYGKPLKIRSLGSGSTGIDGDMGPIGPTGEIGPTGNSINSMMVFGKTSSQTTQNGSCAFDDDPIITSGESFVTNSNGTFTFSSKGTYMTIINYSSSTLLNAKISGYPLYYPTELEVQDYPKKGSITGVISVQEGSGISWVVSSSGTLENVKISFIKLSESTGPETTESTEPSGPTGPTGSSEPPPTGFEFSLGGDAIGSPTVKTYTTKRSIVANSNPVEYEFGDITITNIKIENTPDPTDSSYSNFVYWISKDNSSTPLFTPEPLTLTESGASPTYTLTSSSVSFAFAPSVFNDPPPTIGAIYNARIYVKNQISTVSKFLPIKIRVTQ